MLKYMRNPFLILLVLMFLGLGVLTIYFDKKEGKAIKNLEEERYSRMVAEETLQKSAGKLAVLYAQLKDQQNKIVHIQETLAQSKAANAALLAAKAKLEDALQKKQA